MTTRSDPDARFTPMPVELPSMQCASGKGTNVHSCALAVIGVPNVIAGSLVAQSKTAGATGPGGQLCPASGAPASIGPASMAPLSLPASGLADGDPHAQANAINQETRRNMGAEPSSPMPTEKGAAQKYGFSSIGAAER